MGSNQDTAVNTGASGLRGSCIVGRRVSSASHGDNHADDIDPHSSISQPSELLQGANLAQKKANERPDQTADDKAQLELGGLGQCFTVGDNDQTDVQQQLNALQDVEEMSDPRPVKTETEITEAAYGELVRVKAEKRFPQKVTGITGQTGEDGK